MTGEQGTRVMMDECIFIHGLYFGDSVIWSYIDRETWLF